MRWLQVIVTTLLERKDCQSKPRLRPTIKFSQMGKLCQMTSRIARVRACLKIATGCLTIEEILIIHQLWLSHVTRIQAVFASVNANDWWLTGKSNIKVVLCVEKYRSYLMTYVFFLLTAELICNYDLVIFCFKWLNVFWGFIDTKCYEGVSNAL